MSISKSWNRPRVLRLFLPTARLLAVLSLLVLPFGAEAAQTSTNDAKAFLNTLIDDGQAILDSDAPEEEKKEELRTMMVNRFHVEAVGRFVLGRHLKALEDDQLEAYYPIFREYVLATFLGRVASVADYEMSVNSAERYGDDDVLVRTTAAFEDGDQVNIGWRVRKVDDKLLIIDMLLEGVSLAVTQRSDFRSVLSRGGLEGLIKAMRKKIDSAR